LAVADLGRAFLRALGTIGSDKKFLPEQRLVALHLRNAMTLSKPGKPIRHHIETQDMKHWSKHWKVLPEQILVAVEKVGNSVAAVQKELRLQGLIDEK
jgi:Protein of unknown function (DUF3606)